MGFTRIGGNLIAVLAIIASADIIKIMCGVIRLWFERIIRA